MAGKRLPFDLRIGGQAGDRRQIGRFVERTARRGRRDPGGAAARVRTKARAARRFVRGRANRFGTSLRAQQQEPSQLLPQRH